MKKISLFLIAVTTLLFTGCASYQANSLSALDPHYVKSYPEVEGVSIGCKAYTVDDCFTYLDRNVIAQGYQPIQLTFQNNTNKHYSFSTRDLSLPTTNPNIVANTVHTSTAGRVTGYAVGGLFVWPLFIPAVVDGIKSSNANAALDRDFQEKSLQHLNIAPYSFSKTLIFVPKNQFAPVFNISLQDQETGKQKTVTLNAYN